MERILSSQFAVDLVKPFELTVPDETLTLRALEI
jgi:hypothetical protein